MIRIVLVSMIPIIIILLTLLKIGLNNKDFVQMQKELTKPLKN